MNETNNNSIKNEMKDQWHCWNQVLVAQCAPHALPELSYIKNKSIWKKGNVGEKALVARWTDNFDCGVETDWWYCIKDTPLDLDSLKAKRRYEITKARKKFTVKKITATEYTNELFEVTKAAYSDYPKKYRPKIDYDSFRDGYVTWIGVDFIAAFYNSSENEMNGKIAGYCVIGNRGAYIDLIAQKAYPNMQREGVNAALVDYVCTEHHDLLVRGGGYILDGERSVYHETEFQNYLEKYFGFRKAYCRLNIEFHPKYKWLVNIVYPIRGILKHFDKIAFVHKINSALSMLELSRKTQKQLKEKT